MGEGPLGRGLERTWIGRLMYLWLKASHIIAVIAWMAGMLYLPRLFVYHVDAPKGSAQVRDLQGHGAKAAQGDHQSGDDRGVRDGTAARLRHRLLAGSPGSRSSSSWPSDSAQRTAISPARSRSSRADDNTRPASFFRLLNEVPTVLMILIVLLVVVKPLVKRRHRADTAILNCPLIIPRKPIIGPLHSIHASHSWTRTERSGRPPRSSCPRKSGERSPFSTHS